MPTVMVFTPVRQLTVTMDGGDSMTAAVATVLARGGDLHEAVRMGAAAGALNVTRHGLGTGRHEAITELAARVELTPV